MKTQQTQADQYEMAANLAEEFARMIDATSKVPRFALLAKDDKDRLAAIAIKSHIGRELVADALLNDNFLASQLTIPAINSLCLAGRYCEIRNQIFSALEDVIDTEIDAFNSDGDYRSSLFSCATKLESTCKPVRKIYLPPGFTTESAKIEGEVTPEFSSLPVIVGDA